MKMYIIKSFIKLTSYILINILKNCYRFIPYTEPYLIRKRLIYRYNSREITERLYSIRAYKNKKLKKYTYNQNMELMLKLSEKKGIPQHILLTLFNNYPENCILNYKAQDYIDGEIYFIHYYMQEIKNHLKASLLYIKEKFMDRYGEEIRYNYYENILIQSRRKTYLQKNLMMNKWYAFNFFKKQKNRRTKNIKYFKNHKLYLSH